MYEITLDGCDDSTTARIDLNEQELETLVKVAQLLNAESNYRCMPTMRIEKINTAQVMRTETFKTNII